MIASVSFARNARGGALGVALSADGHLLVSGSTDGTMRLWEPQTGTCLRTLRPERRYERMHITRLSGITEGQRTALLALGAVEHHAPARESTASRSPETEG